MFFTTDQIESLAPKPEAFKAGSKLSGGTQWIETGVSSRAIWGKIKGSGIQPYFTQIDLLNFATKCTCPSRQFPCKHGIGLLLFYAGKTSVDPEAEPDWVVDWIDKRKHKEVAKVERVLTEAEQEKRESEKEKRIENRKALITSGVDDLDLWLLDLMKKGLLELPNIPKHQFKNLAARMVDAKAPGLASLVKALGEVTNRPIEIWYYEAQEIIAKLYLLLQAWKNYDSLTPDYQATIKSMVGWSQSPKELLESTDAIARDGNWLVLGQEREFMDDLLVMRTWFYGIESGISCYELTFAFGNNPIEIKYVPGTILNATMVFFNGVLLQRCLVKKVSETDQQIRHEISKMSDFIALSEVMRYRKSIMPWVNNETFLVENIDIVQQKKNNFLRDRNNNLIKIHPLFDELKMKQWILTTGNHKVDAAIVVKEDLVLPIGFFKFTQYQVI